MRRLTKHVKYVNDMIADFELEERRVFENVKEGIDLAAHTAAIDANGSKAPSTFNFGVAAPSGGAESAPARLAAALAAADVDAAVAAAEELNDCGSPPPAPRTPVDPHDPYADCPDNYPGT